MHYCVLVCTYRHQPSFSLPFCRLICGLFDIMRLITEVLLLTYGDTQAFTVQAFHVSSGTIVVLYVLRRRNLQLCNR